MNKTMHAKHVDCGLRIADCGFEIQNPKSQIRNRRGPRGFTLMELLVVIGIIALLMGILIPSVGHFRAMMRKSAITTYMGSIQSALAAYEQDFKELPPSNGKDFDLDPDETRPLGLPPDTAKYFVMGGVKWNGGEILTQALVGPLPAMPSGGVPFGDGQDGYGFKATLGGDANRKSTAYINIKSEYNLRPRWDKDGNGTADNELWSSDTALDMPEKAGRYVLTMSYGGDVLPFLYYKDDPRSGRGTGDLIEPNKNDRIWGPKGRFDINDNKQLTAGKDPADRWTLPSVREEDRLSFVTSLRSKNYLLVHAGANELFGGEDSADDVYQTGVRTR